MDCVLDKFYKYIASVGINVDDVFEQREAEFTLVSFAEEGQDGSIYNLSLVFYIDDSVEVYVRKSIEQYEKYEVLLKLNELNAEYKGVTFLIDEDMLTVKSYCLTNGDVKVVLREMIQDVEIAQTEYKNII